MGCGCGGGGRKGIRNVGRNPIITPKQRSVQRGAIRGLAPTDRKQLLMKQNEERGFLSRDRREVERKRRIAIQQAALKKFRGQ